MAVSLSPSTSRVMRAHQAAAAFEAVLMRGGENRDGSGELAELWQATLDVLDHEPKQLEACLKSEADYSLSVLLVDELWSAIAAAPDHRMERTRRWCAHIPAETSASQESSWHRDAIFALLQQDAWDEVGILCQKMPHQGTDEKTVELILKTSVGRVIQDRAWAWGAPFYRPHQGASASFDRVIQALGTAQAEGKVLPLAHLQALPHDKQADVVARALWDNYPSLAVALWNPAQTVLQMGQAAWGQSQSLFTSRLGQLQDQVVGRAFPEPMVRAMMAGVPTAERTLWDQTHLWLAHQQRSRELAQRSATVRATPRRRS